MKNLDLLFAALAKSKFRSKFQLQAKDQLYIQTKGMPTVLEHAQAFIAQRLAPADVKNDGKQTPFRGHPVFIAQHATACCCRGCLQQWHGIATGVVLSQAEQGYILNVLQRWLDDQLNNPD